MLSVLTHAQFPAPEDRPQMTLYTLLVDALHHNTFKESKQVIMIASINFGPFFIMSIHITHTLFDLHIISRCNLSWIKFRKSNVPFLSAVAAWLNYVCEKDRVLKL